MFKQLLSFEFKKVFHNKKCIILFIIMLATIGIFIYGSIENIKALQIDKQDNVSQQLNSFRGSFDENLLLIDSSSEYFNKKCAALVEKEDAIREYNWRDELKADINLNNVEINKLKNDGITDDDSLKVYNAAIKKDSWYLENNIQPVDVKKSILGPFFLINLFRTIFPLILVLFLMMTVCDIFSGEFDEGSYKLLLIQPIKHSKILLTKLITSLVLNLVFFFLSILPVYFIISNVNTFFTGKGSWIHPVTINKNFMLPFSAPVLATSSVGEEFKYILPAAIFAVIMITCIGFLISVCCSSSLQSVVISTVVAIAIYFLDLILNQYNLNFLSIDSYFNFINLIEGKAGRFLNLSSAMGISVLITFAFIAASAIVMKHKQFDK